MSAIVRGQKLTTPKRFRYLIYAYPIIAPDAPFPVKVLSNANSFGLHLTPNSERESSRIQLNPVLGNTEPFFLRGVSDRAQFTAKEFGGWNFVPVQDELQHHATPEELEQVKIHAALNLVVDGNKDQKLRYAHYARVHGGDFFLDMLRYDRCAPATDADAQELLRNATERDGVDLYVVQLREEAKPNWTPARHYASVTLEPVNYIDLPERVMFP